MVSDKSRFIRQISSALRPAHLASAIFLALFVSLFLYFYRINVPDPPKASSSSEYGVGALEVLFSAPDQPGSRTLRNGPDADLAASIASAQRSVDVAAYDLDLWSVRDALIEAASSGAIVRVVVESTNYEQPEIQDLLKAGIAVVPDTSKALMHHKFVIVDEWDVWTGSMNFTLNGAYRNDNNLLHIQSANLAQNYRQEFEEMFLEGRFGRLSRRDTPYPVVQIDSARVEAYFSPDDGALSEIMAALSKAERQVLVMAFTLTSDEITELLIQRAAEGLDVRVIMEASQIRNTGNDFERLLESGVDVRTDGNPYNMHHKVMIMDGEIVVAGSYNFTRSAEERNDENLIIIWDEDLATSYLVEFSRAWEAAKR